MEKAGKHGTAYSCRALTIKNYPNSLYNNFVISRSLDNSTSNFEVSENSGGAFSVLLLLAGITAFINSEQIDDQKKNCVSF